MKRALVTGHAGFIGRHFKQRLEEWGWFVDGCDIAEGYDCRELFALNQVQYDLVVHCAANVGGRVKIDGDPLAVAENLAIDSDMWRWAARTKQRRVVYFSSSAAYPVELQRREQHWRLEEQDVDLEIGGGVPDQTYGWAKLTGERLAPMAAAEGVTTHIFRPFSGYGSDQSLDYPFPSFIQRALARPKLFQVWGDGRQTRDFIHVYDIFRLVMNAVEGGRTKTYNLCTGRATSFNTLAEMVCTAAGHELRLDHLTARPTGVHYRVGNPTLMQTELGTPRISLEEGIWRALKDNGVNL